MKSVPAAMIFGGGEYTGTDSYTDLTHKPRINDVELSGTKSAEDLGLANADDVYTKTEVDDLLDDKVNNTDIVTSFDAESSDEKIPSEKLVKTSLDELNVKIPNAPDTDGTYTLKVTVTDGVPSYNWVSD